MIVLLFSMFFLRSENKSVQGDALISIIVVVRNELDCVINCLNALFEQDFPQSRFEIIVVDDNSTDGTTELLRTYSRDHPIHFIAKSKSSKYKSSKKAALEIAVLQARGNFIFFTDADCLPGPKWISAMVACFDETTGLVAGFSPQKAESVWLSNVMKVDAAAAAFVAAGTISLGCGVTCTGRNLAVRKQALRDIGGYASFPDSLSGDDDFMLQKISNHPAWEVKYAFDSRAVVPAWGPSTLGQFLKQKQRHISAGRHFRLFSQAAFALFHLANLGLWTSLVFAPFCGILCLAPFAAKLCIDFFSLFAFQYLFDQRSNIAAFLLWQPLFLFYNIFAGPCSFIKKQNWKSAGSELPAEKNK